MKVRAFCWNKPASDGVYQSVRLLRIVYKAIKYLFLTIVAIFLVLVVTAHIQQHLTYRRAVRLLDQISSLRLRETPAADALQIRKEWNRFSYTEGRCESGTCVINFTLNDFFDWKARVLTLNYKAEWPINFLLLARYRPSRVRGTMYIRDGTVWGKDFSVWVSTYRGFESSAQAIPPYTLMAEVGSSSQLGYGAHVYSELWLHPNYVIGRPGGCTFCRLAYTKFTPYTEHQETKRLMQINLRCLISWKQCETEYDILPQPWEQHESELPFIWNLKETCTPKLRKIVAREAQSVALVAIEDFASPSENDLKVKARMIKAFKPNENWPVGTSRGFHFSRSNLGDPGMTVRKNDRVFLMYFLKDHDIGPWPLPCGLIPSNDSDQKAVQEGINEDYRALERDNR